MLGKFIYGQCSLSEAFWKFCFLGLLVIGFLTRILMIFLKQTVNYDTNFMRVAINSMSIFQGNSKALAFLAFYVASFLTLVVYSILCLIAMWNTYKEYEKSKTLALISILVVAVIEYFAIKFSIY